MFLTENGWSTLIELSTKFVRYTQKISSVQGYFTLWNYTGLFLILTQIIYTTIRHHSAEELNWYLEDCLQLKQEFPHLIAGDSPPPCNVLSVFELIA